MIGDGDRLQCTVMGMGMEEICAGTDEDGDRVQRKRLGMDFKYAGSTNGDGDKLSSPRSSLTRTS